MNMRVTLVWLSLVLPLAAQGDADLAAWAKNVGDYRTKFRLIRAGLPALEYLMPQAASADARLAFESRSAIRWIVSREKERKQVAHHLVRHYCGGNNPVVVRVLCAELLADLDQPTTVGMLSAMLTSDETVALACVDALRRMSGAGATDALVSDLKQATGKRRIAIYRALGLRRDKRVLPLLLDAAKGGNATAVAALGDAGFPEAEGLLAALAKKGSKTAYLALLKCAERDAGALMTAHEVTGTAAQVLLWIDAAARIRPESMRVLDELFKYAETPTFKTPAYLALLSILDAMDATSARPLVRSILESLTGSDSEKASDAALIRALAGAGRCRDPQAVPLVLKHVRHEHANVRTTAIAALADIEGHEATDALIATLGRAGQPATQTMILQALATRADPRAAPALEEWMKPGEGDPAIKREAVRAYVAIANGCDEAQARTMYRKALWAGATAEAIDGLAEVGEASDLDLLGKLLESDQKKAALRAVLGIGKRAKGAGAIKAYRLALNAGAMVENELRLLGEAVEITARGGRVGAWWVNGPYKAEKTADWTRAEPPERAVDLKQGWRPVQVGGKDAIVDFDSLFSPNDQVTAYAYAEIWVRKDRDATLKCGSDDGIRIWINGALVHSKLELRSLTVDEDSVGVQLKKGRNTLLVKVCEMSGGWNFHVRLLDAKQRPLKFKIR